MSPVDQISVKDKLFKLDLSIRLIEELMSRDRNILFKDDVLKSAIYFNLIVSIEIILDIGNHILSSEFNRPEDNYESIIYSLGMRGIIPKELADENKGMGSFRNLLVHDYGKIDDKKALEYAEKAPAIFRKFGEIFIKMTEPAK